METKNILVFPCGSEIGLEIHRSLKYSTHINLFGASSFDDHGKYVYQNYISGLPFFDHPEFIRYLKKVIVKHQIDAIYPSMDSVVTKLAIHEEELGCKVIGSPELTTKICLSKLETYKVLDGKVLVPKMYESIEKITCYPVFMKPATGYGSRGAKLIHTDEGARQHLKSFPTSLILEYLPGKEYTVDCFTDKRNRLLFAGPRERSRITNGISVNTVSIQKGQARFFEFARRITSTIQFRGAWFFQVKENYNGDLALLEVACRLGGSSGLFRNLGVNFALLSVFDAFGHEVQILPNNYTIALDRALSNRYKIGIDFSHVYVDFDDCIIVNEQINTELILFLYKSINEKKKIILITKHAKNLDRSLEKFRLRSLFDEIIHLKSDEEKWRYVTNLHSIFIDDSFKERRDVYKNLKIPVFSPDAVESLL